MEINSIISPILLRLSINYIFRKVAGVWFCFDQGIRRINQAHMAVNTFNSISISNMRFVLWFTYTDCRTTGLKKGGTHKGIRTTSSIETGSDTGKVCRALSLVSILITLKSNEDLRIGLSHYNM